MSSTGHAPELESLRSQVADLARELAERDRLMQTQSRHLEQTMLDLREQSELLQAIVEGTAATIGDEFFQSLVGHLAKALKVRHALVGEWREDAPETVRTLAVWSGTAVAEPFEYRLRGTPCANVLGQRLCLYESAVQRRFPEDHLLAEMGIESYCGIPLFDRSGKPLGLLVVMDDRPMTRTALVTDLLKIFAARAGVELARQRAEQALKRSEAHFRALIEQASDIFTVLAIDGTVQYHSPSLQRVLGWRPSDRVGLSAFELLHPEDLPRAREVLRNVLQHPGTPHSMECRFRHQDGSWRALESLGTMTQDPQGIPCIVINSRDVTERHRVERERLQALNDLRNVMETVPDFMFTLDTQGNFVTWNRRVGEITGYSPEELLNKPALAFVPPGERTRTAAAIQQAFTEGYAELDGHLLTKDHRMIPYHWTGATLKNPQGEIIGITGIGRDVSAQKCAEQQLEEQRRHLLSAQALARLGSWDWDIDSGEVQWSDEHFRIFGHEPGAGAVTYDTFLASLHPDDHDRVLAAVNDALLGKMLFDLECRIVRPNGEVRTIQCRGDVHRSATGHPIRMEGTVLDITERKQVEDALRASEERWHLAVQGSTDGIWDWNIRTGEVFFSTRWKAMRGYEAHELPNALDEWRSRIHPDDLERVLQAIDAYLDRRCREYYEEYRVQRKDGSYMWVLDRGVALWNEDGTPIRMAGSESDITERKRAEEALRQSRARFAAFMRHLPGIAFMKDSDGRHVFVNEAFETLFNLTRAEWDGKTNDDLFPPDIAATFTEHDRLVMREGIPVHTIETTAQADGLHTWLVAKFPVRLDDHTSPMLGGVAIDITDRTRAEEQRDRQYRQLQTMYRMTVALSQANAVEDLYEEALNGICSALNADRAAILLFDEDGVMRFTASRGLSERYKQAVEGHSPWSREAVNPSPIMIPDAAEDSSVEAYKAIFLAEGIRALGFIPLGSSDGLLGKFMLYYDCPHQFTEEESQVAQMIAGHVAFMIQRRRAEEALSTSQTTLDAVIRSLPSGIVFANPERKMVFANEALLRIFGMASSDAMDGLDCHAMAQQVKRLFREPEQFVRCTEKILARREPMQGEELALVDGRVFERDYVPVYLGTTFLGNLWHYRNITDRKRAEEERAETHLALTNAMPGISRLDREGRYLSVNDAYAAALGYEPPELVGRDWAPTIHPDDRALAQAAYQRMRDEGKGEFEARAVRKDGTLFYKQVLMVKRTDEQGVFVGHYGFMQDITRRKWAENKLRETEDLYHLLLQSTGEGIFGLDMEGRCTFINQAAAAMFGYAPNEVLGMNTHLLFHHSHPNGSPYPVEACPIFSVFRTGRGCLRFAEAMWRRDGTLFPVEYSSFPIVKDGVMKGVVVSIADITDRKRAEEVLARRERELRTVLDTLPVGVWFTDATGKVLLANPAGRKIWQGVRQVGLDQGSDQTRWWEQVGPMAEPHRWALTRALIKGESSLNETLEIECHDGSRKTIRNSAVPVRHDDGVILGAIIVNEDITERVRAETEKVRSQAFLQSIVENIPHMITVKDAGDLRFVSLNQAGEQLLGRSRAALMGQTVYALLPETDADRVYEQDLAVLASGQPVEIPEHVLGTREHGPRILRTKKLPIFDAAGHPAYLMSISEDITDRVQAEKDLRMSHQFLRQVIDTDPNFIFAKDRDGRFTLVNQAVADAYGTTVDNLIGKTDADFNPNEAETAFFRQKDLDVMDRLQERFIPEEVITDSTGKTRWLQTVKRPILDEHGRATMVLGASTDITERRKIEETLRQRERDLRVALEERERISQDLHDGILQSLYAVGLGLESCKPLMKQRRRNKAFATLEQAIGQLNHVMAEVRNFIAGLESQVMKGGAFPTALRTMVQTLTASQPIRCTVTIDEMAARRVSTEQALHLLNVAREALSNSLRHGQATRARVSLQLLSHSIRLSVTDNGAGFHPDRAQGIGHGLANMAARAQRMGGRFTVHSRLKQGTRITVDLPKEVAYVHG